MRTKMFTIDDGARHTICAPDASAAMAEYARMLIDSGSDWPPEKPDVAEVPPAHSVTVDLQVNLFSKIYNVSGPRAYEADSMLRKPTLTAAEWCELVGTRYLACSEY